MGFAARRLHQAVAALCLLSMLVGGLPTESWFGSGRAAAATAAALPRGCQIFTNARLVVNGKQVFPDVPLLVNSGRMLVPIRIVAETLGAQVDWDGANRAAVVTTPSRRVVMPIDSTAATVNGVEITLDAPAVLYMSRTLVPLRFVAESMGCEVSWDPTARTASVTSPAARLTGVAVDLHPHAAVLKIATDSVVPYSVKTLADPPRLIVDLEGVTPAVGWAEQPVGRALIDRVRLVVTDTPVKLTRVICDLADAVRFSHRPSTTGPGVEVEVYYKVSAVAWEDGGVSVRATGPVQSRAMILTGPDRYVVDMPGATLVGGPGTIEVGQEGIRRIRFAQFQSNPDIVRVVLDLDFPKGLKVVVGEAGLRIVPQMAVAAIAYETTADGGRLRLETSGAATAQAVVASDGRAVRLEISGAAAAGTGNVVVMDGLVESYEVLAVSGDSFAVVIRLTGYLGHQLRTDAGIVTLDLAASPLAGRKIVVDPGHGGIDPGCTSYSKVFEKAVNLPIAMALRERLERAGAIVVMTRYGDTSINAYGRVEVANSWGAEVFVSVHCNAHVDRRISGTEVWHFGDKAESLRLARLMMGELAKLGMVNRGVKKGNYAVLRETTMPAVLVELGFLTNPGDERILLNPANQLRAADLMFEALKAYFR
jgi:N-acetylmuramoyl-L-alanine amidase